MIRDKSFEPGFYKVLRDIRLRNILRKFRTLRLNSDYNFICYNYAISPYSLTIRKSKCGTHARPL